MATPPNAILIARLIHTGFYADGRPNTASVLIPDGDWGLSQQNRKTPLYVPAGGFIDVSLTSDTLYSLSSGSIAGFVLAGVLRVELIMRLRDPADLGGAGGTGIGLSAVVGVNIARTANVLSFVIDALDAAGFVVEENMTVVGLSGAFSALNGTYEITAVTKGADLVGANPLTWLIEVTNVGANLVPALLAGVTLTLPQGKVRYEVRGSGNAGGLGTDSTVYVGGDINVTGLVDPTALQLTPILAGDAPNGSLFVDSTTGLLYFKDADGNLVDLESGGGGGGGGGNSFTYRPGGAPVPSANVYDTWAACHAAASAWPSTATMVIDSSLVSPAPIPAGTWNMSGIILAGSMEAVGGIPFSDAECQDGTVLTNLLYITNLLRLTSVSSSPVISVPSFMFMLVDLGSILSRTGSAAMFEVGAGGSLNIIVLRGSRLSGAVAPLISVLPDGVVIIQLYEICTVDSGILEGTSVNPPQYIVSSPAASFSDVNPAWLGAPVSIGLNADADRIGFTQTGPYGLPNNVGGAINELATRTTGVTKDADATSENIWADRANQTPTIGAFAGQVNLGSESVAAKGTEGNYASVLSGLDNLATGDYAGVAGGLLNIATGQSATISGGGGNIATGDGATVSGGSANTATGEGATIAGGFNNIANGAKATVSGGTQNNATGTVAYVGGGQLNVCGVQYGGILAGYNNNILGISQGGGILCGQNNLIDSTGAQNAILGGDNNNVTGGTEHASILGGLNNVVQGNRSIGGGESCNLNHANTFLFAGTGSTVDSQEANQVHFGVTNGLRISNTVEEDGYVLKILEAQTTDATVTTLWAWTVTDLSAMYVKIRVTAVETDGSNRACYDKAVLVYRSGGGAVIQGAVLDLVTIESDPAWDCDFVIDTNEIQIRITGEATSTINWRGTVTWQAAS